MSLHLVITNDKTGTEKKANYRYRVQVNNDELLAEGEVRGHVRSSGWRALLHKVAEDIRVKKSEDIFLQILKGTRDLEER